MRRSRWLLVLVAALLILPTAPAEAQETTLLERLQAQAARAEPGRTLGYLSENRYLPGSTSPEAARYDADSPANEYSRFGSQYSSDGERNPYATGGAKIVGQDGRYLGRLNANRYDSESVSNPYGKYGSPYNTTSVNNPYGRYGSEFSTDSAQNPYATKPPLLLRPER